MSGEARFWIASMAFLAGLNLGVILFRRGTWINAVGFVASILVCLLWAIWP